jgi:amino acid transporter
MSTHQSEATSEKSLDRQIGLRALLLIGVTSIIGSGWLFAALYAAQIAGPASIVSWLIGGVIVIALALIYAELGGMLPVAGALATIPRFSHGPLSGFMAGWLCWISYVTLGPIEVTATLEYASNYLPGLTTDSQGERALTTQGLFAATGLMLLFTLINVVGVKWLARSTSIITVWKIVVPIMAALVLMEVGFQSDNFQVTGGFAPMGATGIFAAVSGGGILFSLLGFRVVIDMAGEAKNPQRNVPLAIMGAVGICLVIYVLLQVAFIGVIPAAHLANGWANIVEDVSGGPFAGFAVILGLQWLAMTLYADAIISPAGTALTFIGTTARINYAMSKSKQFPALFQRLNKARVPIWSLVFNFIVGMLLFLPFPGWAELVGFISSASVLSFSFGPVSLAALRYQAADRERPYKTPLGITFPAVAFIFVGFAVYWTGWETNYKVFLVALGGLVLLLVARLFGHNKHEPLMLRHTNWFWLYLAGLAFISWLGNYGHGLGVIPTGVDMALLAALSLGCFWVALRTRLPNEQAQQFIEDAL